MLDGMVVYVISFSLRKCRNKFFNICLYVCDLFSCPSFVEYLRIAYRESFVNGFSKFHQESCQILEKFNCICYTYMQYFPLPNLRKGRSYK